MMDDLVTADRLDDIETALNELGRRVMFIMTTARATLQPAGSRLAINAPPPEIITLAELYERIQREQRALATTGTPRRPMP